MGRLWRKNHEDENQNPQNGSTEQPPMRQTVNGQEWCTFYERHKIAQSHVRKHARSGGATGDSLGNVFSREDN